MEIKDTITTILSIVGYFFAVVFYVLFQLKKDENKQLEVELKESNKQLENERIEKTQLEETLLKYNADKKENQELLAAAKSGDNNAALDLLHKLATKNK